MYRIGIDLGGTNIKAGIVDENNTIILEESVATLVERGFEPVIKDMAELVLHIMKKAGITRDEVLGVGIGSPGTVDAINGVVLYSNNFGWEKIPLAEIIHSYLKMPIAISNDANCAALGEVKAGAAKDCNHVILLTLGTGVGGGIVLGGKIFEGGHAGGAELGHTIMIKDGEPCSCGRKGCFEAYASATALIRDTKRAALANKESLLYSSFHGDVECINGKTVFDMAEIGDVTAQQVMNNYIEYLGEGIVDMINIFRPEKVLLSGGVCNQGKNLTDPLNNYVSKYCFAGENAFIPKVTCATLGNSAGIIGAAALILG